MLEWDKTGERRYETGVDHGVLYPASSTGTYPEGVVWNGLTTVTESPSGAEASPQYADNIKYLNLFSAEEFGATIEAFTYPDEFAECDGTAAPIPGVAVGQQTRKKFGLSYRTKVGNDTEGQDHGYKIHLIWGASASPSEKAYNTVNDSPEAITFSWELTTEAVSIGSAYPNLKPTASMTLDSTVLSDAQMKAVTDVLYGAGSNTEARLPLPAEILSLLSGVSGTSGVQSFALTSEQTEGQDASVEEPKEDDSIEYVEQ